MPQDEENVELMLENEYEEDEVSVTYDIATYPSDFTLSGINDMWENHDIVIPDFQREFVWTIRQSSLLIESFLLGLPVPPVFFYIDETSKSLVIDGQQRILSIIFFFQGYFGSENTQGRHQVFRLKYLGDESPYKNKSFTELDDADQRKLKQTVLRAINVRQLSPDGENTCIYHIFERLNTGGTPLKPQEIRNCVFRGPIVKYLRKLNKNKDWRAILGKKHLDKHQKDVELLLRVCALSNNVGDYEKPMKAFLNRWMAGNRNADSNWMHLFKDRFEKVTQIIISELGEKPFHLRGPLNSSALDSVFSILLNVEKLPINLSERWDQLCSNEQFIYYTSTSTQDTSVLRARFQLVKDMLLA